MAGSATISGFIGRAAELGRLEAAYARIGDGIPLTVCVGGEAGVGKTRLVSEFTGRVLAGGGCVLTGGCIELAEASLPYAPVVEALRGLARSTDPATLEELAGPGRPLLHACCPNSGGAASRRPPENPCRPRRRRCSRRSSPCWSASPIGPPRRSSWKTCTGRIVRRWTC